MQAWTHLKDGFAWNVGDGKSVSFWKDRWIPNFGTLESYALKSQLKEDMDKKVAEYTSSARDQNWIGLNQMLLESICLWIATVVPPYPNGGKDVLRWQFSKDGSLMEEQYERVCWPRVDKL